MKMTMTKAQTLAHFTEGKSDHGRIRKSGQCLTLDVKRESRRLTFMSEAKEVQDTMREALRPLAAIPRAEWEWFGHAGHFICARWCQFHLCTKVGGFLVSTVGEYWPDRTVREIHARCTDPQWLDENRNLKGDYFDSAYMKRFGFKEIGCDRKYETMVFKAGARCAAIDCGCGLPSINGSALETGCYNDAGAAARGHFELCEKAARGLIEAEP
jgi:hypothetical protein